jgi:hypothetical protein
LTLNSILLNYFRKCVIQKKSKINMVKKIFKGQLLDSEHKNLSNYEIILYYINHDPTLPKK